MEGPLKPESNIELSKQALIEKWKQGQVILASSSKYRMDELRKLGYDNVVSAAVPDAAEKRKHKEIIVIEGKRGHFFDKQKTEIPQRIAEAKIEYLLDCGNVSPDAMIVALDTLPMTFRRVSDEEKKEDPLLSWWPADHMSKPESLEDARARIFELFSYISNEYLIYEDNIKKQISYLPEEDPIWVRDMLDTGRLPKLVRINTGIAIRFPGCSEIETTSNYINLRLLKVYDLANKPDELRILADKVVQIMLDKGKSPLNIGGGIDYSDPDIRDLLHVDELSLYEETEDGVYRGFPSKTFEKFVSSVAGKLIKGQ